MVAHLYRYGSELALLAEIVEDIKQYNRDFDQKFVDMGIRKAEAIDLVWRDLRHITTQLSSISRFRDELQLKTDNVLALVCYRLPCKPVRDCKANNPAARR
jgi:hypothetical protein